jgi:YaiO family outer membrane protein
VVDKHKFLRVLRYQIAILGLFLGCSTALALEVIEGIGKRSALTQEMIQEKEIEAIEAIKEAEPKHELGFDFDKAHISDLKTYWNYGKLFYYHVDEYGKFGAVINQLKKFDHTAEQYLLDLQPKVDDNIYLKLLLAQASESQSNFPSRQYGFEAYLSVPQGFEFSMGHGGRIYKNFNNEKLFSYNLSISYLSDDYFAWFRPTNYTPGALMFYEIGMMKYAGDRDNYLKLTASTGKFPSIGDVVPLNQLFIAKQALGVNVGGQFSVIRHVYLRWGIGYARIMYPNDLNRYITDGNIGLLWRF